VTIQYLTTSSPSLSKAHSGEQRANQTTVIELEPVLQHSMQPRATTPEINDDSGRVEGPDPVVGLHPPGHVNHIALTGD